MRKDLQWLAKRAAAHGIQPRDYLLRLAEETRSRGCGTAGDFPVINRAVGFKLLSLRADGTLGPLFINRPQVISIGEWLRAECHQKRGYKLRPGWHVAPRPDAPHLGTAGRVWRRVEIVDFEELPRPEAQGGTWWIARWMRVIPEDHDEP